MILVLAAIIVLFLLINRPQPKLLGSASNSWNTARIDDMGTYLSMGTDWEVCNVVIEVTNKLSYPITLKSSRWWRDSNTFIENLKEIKLQPRESTKQNVGWAGFGAKEYRVYFYKPDGSPESTGNLEFNSWRPVCGDIWGTELGLTD